MKNANESNADNESMTNKYMDNQSEILEEKNGKNFPSRNIEASPNGKNKSKNNNIAPISHPANNININLNFNPEEKSENKQLNKKIHRKNNNNESDSNNFAVPLKKNVQNKPLNVSLNLNEEEKPKKIKKNNPLALDHNNIVLNLSEESPFKFPMENIITDNRVKADVNNENETEENLSPELIKMKLEYKTLKNEYEKLKNFFDNNNNTSNLVEFKEKEKLKKKIKKRLKTIKEVFQAS